MTISIEAFMQFALRNGNTPYVYIHNYPKLVKELLDLPDKSYEIEMILIGREDVSLVRLWNRKDYDEYKTRPADKGDRLEELRDKMLTALDNDDFATVITIRKQIKELKESK